MAAQAEGDEKGGEFVSDGDMMLPPGQKLPWPSGEDHGSKGIPV